SIKEGCSFESESILACRNAILKESARTKLLGKFIPVCWEAGIRTGAGVIYAGSISTKSGIDSENLAKSFHGPDSRKLILSGIPVKIDSSKTSCLIAVSFSCPT
ncbi:MAG: hypothetical protein AAB969_00590, partial [Patescibacteria group bacterium]